MTKNEASRVIEKRATERGGLISILEEIQAREGFLPEDVLRLVAERTGRSLTDVYGVATFYRAFSLKPRGQHVCTVCTGTACHVRGAARLVEKLERDLGVKAGETTPDMNVTLETVNCVGACALGPLVILDGTYHGNITSAKLDKVMRGVSGRTES